MNRLASPQQLRNSLIRWTLFTVPLVVLLGFLSGMVSGSGADNAWFMTLEKPSLYPPPAAFGIVWTILYIMIGFALALICSAWGSRTRGRAIVLFLIQFALNLAWTPTFFALQRIDIALAIIAVLDVMVIVTAMAFYRVRRAAGLLMLPYLAWVLFATALNLQFLLANPDAADAGPSNAVQRIEF